MRSSLLALLVAIGVAVSATPAVAADQPSGPDALNAFCQELGGAYTARGESYRCDLGPDAIVCYVDDRDCGYEATEGVFPEQCKAAGGRVFDHGNGVVECLVTVGNVVVECDPGEGFQVCPVRSEPPIKHRPSWRAAT